MNSESANLFKKIILILGILLITLSSTGQEVTYRVKNSVLVNNWEGQLSKLIILIPIPQTNVYQSVKSFDIGDGQIFDIPGSDNQYWKQILEGDDLPAPGESFRFSYDMEITLKSFQLNLDNITQEFDYDKTSSIYHLYTGPDSTFIVPDHNIIKTIGEKLWENTDGYLAYAKAACNYVADNFRILQPTRGLHHLDTVLRNGGGNYGNLCSILVSLLRYNGIPARHVFTIRPDLRERIWVDFYLEEYGWIPIDLSGKIRNPDGKYFGYYNADGIIMTTGATNLLEREQGDLYLQTWFHDFNWWYWTDSGNNNIQATYQLQAQRIKEENPYSAPSGYYLYPHNLHLTPGETSQKPLVVKDAAGNIVYGTKRWWWSKRGNISISPDGFVTAIKKQSANEQGIMVRAFFNDTLTTSITVRIHSESLDMDFIEMENEHTIFYYPDSINWFVPNVTNIFTSYDLAIVLDSLYENLQDLLQITPWHGRKFIIAIEVAELSSQSIFYPWNPIRFSFVKDDIEQRANTFYKIQYPASEPIWENFIYGFGFNFFEYCTFFKSSRPLYPFREAIPYIAGLEALMKLSDSSTNNNYINSVAKTSIQNFITRDTLAAQTVLNDFFTNLSNYNNIYEDIPLKVVNAIYFQYRNKQGGEFAQRFFKPFNEQYRFDLDNIVVAIKKSGKLGWYTFFAALVSSASDSSNKKGTYLSQEFEEKYNIPLDAPLFNESFLILKEIMNEGQEKVIDPKARLIRIIIILSGIIMFGALIWISFAIRSRVKRKQLEEKKKKMELELRAIRSQMNPHFMFNSLSSIQNLINSGKIKNANIYLSKFATLMRSILNNSREEFIPLNIEIETLKTYFELESLRFNFDHSITIDPALDVFNTEIPGLIVQPYVENAIVHGIAPMEERGKINVDIRKVNKHLLVTIEDNGVGIRSGKTKKRSHKGVGMTISQERLELLNQNKGESWDVKTIDKSDLPNQGTGTIVKITIPLDN